jgi:geranylgeranyl pyrophosphate synthase
MLSGAGDEVAAAVAEFGRLIGLAFQVFDDILDLSGEEQATGKRPGTDVRDGTITLPLILALDLRPGLGALLARDEIDDDDVDSILEDVVRCGALEGARAVALGYIEQARTILDACPNLVERELLNEVAARVVDRYS